MRNFITLCLSVIISVTIIYMMGRGPENIDSRIETTVSDSHNIEFQAINDNVYQLYLHVAELKRDELESYDPDDLTEEEVIYLFVEYKPLILPFYKTTDTSEAVSKWLRDFQNEKL